MTDKKRAFLAMPFRPELRWVREAIRRATVEVGIELRAVDETLGPGEEIVSGIRQEIRDCALAYVVLSDLSPNVMYELGLLHEASKPTILLADKDGVSNLPFDMRTRMVVTFERRAEASDDLKAAVVTATARLLALFEPAARQNVLTAAAGPATQSFHMVQLSVSQYDWQKIRDDGARAVGRKGCSTSNISSHDDGQFKGWRLKARCAGGDTIYVYVDINGDIASVDVQ